MSTTDKLTLIPRTVQVNGKRWDLALRKNEPLIMDLELARQLGFLRERDIRDLIRAHLSSLGEVSRYRAAKPGNGSKGGRPLEGYYLALEQALYITAKSETPAATSILKAMIRAFTLALHGELPDQIAMRARIAELELRLAKLQEQLAETKRTEDRLLPPWEQPILTPCSVDFHRELVEKYERKIKHLPDRKQSVRELSGWVDDKHILMRNEEGPIALWRIDKLGHCNLVRFKFAEAMYQRLPAGITFEALKQMRPISARADRVRELVDRFAQKGLARIFGRKDDSLLCLWAKPAHPDLIPEVKEALDRGESDPHGIGIRHVPKFFESVKGNESQPRSREKQLSLLVDLFQRPRRGRCKKVKARRSDVHEALRALREKQLNRKLARS